MRVTALLVSHDGARWLPAVLDALAAQTRRPDRVLSVHTGAQPDQLALLRSRLGADNVLSAPARTPFGEAVRLGLSADRSDDEWVWLLHDDSAPAPGALEALMAAAADQTDVEVFGPKLREWPSLRRLLEVGVTISGTGRRETGLERGEYDQGQHDRPRDVLAVNTAGMLVRARVLADLGFDRRLPVLGADLDFGWRAARAGHRTRVVPDAVVFHVEAAHQGRRLTALTGPRPRRTERAAALYTLLVNSSLLALPWLLVRLLLGSLLRSLGFLLVRAPREAVDELLALGSVYLRPHRVIAGRRSRRQTAQVPPGSIRHLLAPWWLPYRHGLDFVADLAAALAGSGRDLTEARRARISAETGPVGDETVNLPEDTGLLARLVTSPRAWVFTVLLGLAVAGTRGRLGDGMLSGGALLPAPASAGHWWQTYLDSWHLIGVGSAAPAPPYLLPLALAGTVLAGKAWLVVDLVFLAAVPLSAWGAQRVVARFTGSRTVALWAGVTYGLLPLLTGSVPQGRLGSVAVAVLLPWLVHAASYLAAAEADRRWRACWRTALLLALVASFAPVVWVLAVVVALGGLLAGLVHDRGTWAARGHWGPLLLPLPVALVLLLPWTVLNADHRAGAGWLLEAGRPASGLVGRLSGWDVVLGRPGELGAAPGWLSAGVVVAAVFALLRRDTRGRVGAAWLVLLLGLVSVALLSGLTVELPSSSTDERVWVGVPMLVAQGAAICAAALAATGIREHLAAGTFGWRQPLGVAVVVVAVASPLAGLVWWGWHGTDGPIDRREVTPVPEYMTDAAAADPDQGILVLRGSASEGFTYLVVREKGPRLGDDAVLPSVAAQEPVTALVGSLAAAPTAADIDALAKRGVQFVYASPPVDQTLRGNLDTVPGLEPASSLSPGSRAWRVDRPASSSALAAPPRSVRPGLLVVQGLAVLVAAVLSAPSRRGLR